VKACSRSKLKEGIKVESEHKGTVSFIKDYINKYKKLPSNKMIYSHISCDHLKEDLNYYKKLKKAKL
jgi:sulfur relay (sulfurtransferase) DsrC/TusE family protein